MHRHQQCVGHIFQLLGRGTRLCPLGGQVQVVDGAVDVIEVAPGQEGLCHISELDNDYVKSVNDVVSMGDVVDVKCIAIDEQGRVKLSRKQAQSQGSKD